LGLPMCLFALFTVAVGIDLSRNGGDRGDMIGAGALGAAALLLAAAFVVNLLRGPGCICHLRTAVQSEEVSGIKRIPQAEMILARIRPLLAEAQGTLRTEDIPVKIALAAAPRLVVDDPNLPPRILN